MHEEWQRDLEEFAKRLGIAVPRLIFGWVWWVPASWAKYNALATTTTIIVAESYRDHVDAPARRYLLAHELGHIYERHTLKCVAAVAAGLILGFFGLYWWAAPVKAKMGLILLCLGGAALFWVRYREYQADAVAAQLIGFEEVIEGSQRIGVLSNTSNSKERLRRLDRLRKLQNAARIVPF